MVRVNYPGITTPQAAFAALKPFRDQIMAMAMRVRPGGTDYLILHALIGALDTAAYHFTREPDFFALKLQPSNYRPGSP
ncbi:MAG TPA: hypothetical protein VGF33_03470 [Caulobacteraceae bacterium]|jgi:hypothetical protein